MLTGRLDTFATVSQACLHDPIRCEATGGAPLSCERIHRTRGDALASQLHMGSVRPSLGCLAHVTHSSAFIFRKRAGAPAAVPAARMGKVPVRLREVVYTVSPFEVTILNGLVKDFPGKVMRHLTEVGPRAHAAAHAPCHCVCAPLWALPHIVTCCAAERPKHSVLVRGAHRRHCLVRSASRCA